MNPILEAEYADGYIHGENRLKDISPYAKDKNVFYDIYNGLPEAEHGPLKFVRLFNNGQKWELDWSTLPVGASLIRFKEMRRDKTYEKDPANEDMMLVSEVLTIDAVVFGYKWVDETNTSRENVIRIT